MKVVHLTQAVPVEPILESFIDLESFYSISFGNSSGKNVFMFCLK